MKIQERILWLLVVGLSAFHILNKVDQISDLQTIVKTYDIESDIQESQVNDLFQQIELIKIAQYRNGFEDGRTQAGVAFAHNSSLYSYTDGYHAAISQFGIADTDGKGLTKDFVYDLLLETLEQGDETEASYLELLDLFTNTNEKEENK